MKTAISVPDSTFTRVDRMAKQLGISRSELFARAAEDFLDQLDENDLTQRYDDALARGGSTAVADAQAIAAIGTATLAVFTADDEW